MTETINYTPVGVCTQQISITINDGIIGRIDFTGGCNGNTQGISALARGMSLKEVAEKLRGIQCKNKFTSCPDQLAFALEQYLNK